MKTFYRLNASKVTFREYAFDNPWPLVIPLAGAIKLFHIPMPGSSDDPPVETLAPFEVSEEELPEEVRTRFAPLTEELTELGFGRPIYHQIDCQLQFTHIYWATFAHSSGLAAARIHHRIWSQQKTHKSYLFPVFITESSDGSFLASSAGRRDFLTPDSVEVYYHKGASASELWEEHQARLDEELNGRAVDLRTEDQVREMIERHHAALRDFHLARGVFRPVRAAEQAKLTKQGDAKITTSPTSSVEDAVLRRLEEQRTRRSSWLGFAVILGLSLVAFFLAGMADMNKEFLLMLVPLLLFHELGHYVAMRCFGYRNLRMFFIPFLGAAVSGKNYNIPGWKKAVVALAGPVPGILLGGALGIAGMIWHQKWVVDTAMLAMIINGLNLLPFLPLDGGWVVHAVLFCRHPQLDLAFRIFGLVALLGVSVLLGGRLVFVGVALAMSLPAAWKIASVAHRLRGRQAIAVSPDGVTIPEEATRTILAELGAGKHNRTPANLLAQQVTSIFETLNARPPGPLASAGLVVAHSGSFFLACVLVVVFAIFHHAGALGNPFGAREPAVVYHYTPGASEQWSADGTAFIKEAAPAGRAHETPPLDVVTFLAGYETEQAARAAFAETVAANQAEPGRHAAASRFGQTVVVTLPKDDLAGRQRWKERLDRTAKAVTVAEPNSFLAFRFTCTLPGDQEAEELVRELKAYFQAVPSNRLLPAWSPAWAMLPPQQQQDFLGARRTLGRLATVRRRAYEDPEVKAISTDLTKAFRSRDSAKIREISNRQLKAARDVEDRLMLEIADQDGTDQDVVEVWQRLGEAQKRLDVVDDDQDPEALKEKAAAHAQKQEAVYEELARLVGPLALGATPESKLNLDGCSFFAGILQTGRTVTVSNLSFRCPGIGLPAFGEWLARRQAADIQYSYLAETFDLGSDIDADSDPD